MDIIKDTKQYYLTASAGTSNNSYFKSDVVFDITDLLKDDTNILYNTISIIHCEIPYSFYVVNEYNNLLSLSTGDIYIDYGNYNANSLLKAINLKVPTNMLLSFNSTTGKFSLSYNNSFTINTTTTMYKLLGLENKQYTSSQNIINFPYPANLLGTKNLYIKSNLMLSNFNSITKDYITIASIPVNVEPYSIVLYNNYTTSSHIIKNRKLDYIEIKLHDDNNNLVDFNNVDWTITIEITSYVQTSFTNINLKQYLNNINSI